MTAARSQDGSVGTLDKNLVLLTGGLGTLGQAQAIKLASEGARVLLLDLRDPESGIETAERLAQEASGRITYIQCDLNQLAATETRAAELASAHGGVEILINNAALIINRPFEQFSLEEYEDQIRVNSSAAFALARACAPGMKAKGRGGAVVSEAEERVFGDRLKEYQDWILANQSLKRRIEPRHVAHLVHFLVSPASELISGQNFAVDGGW